MQKRQTWAAGPCLQTVAVVIGLKTTLVGKVCPSQTHSKPWPIALTWSKTWGDKVVVTTSLVKCHNEGARIPKLRAREASAGFDCYSNSKTAVHRAAPKWLTMMPEMGRLVPSSRTYRGPA
jgi:hypothetical protein